MRFYEIEMLELPKILFACTAETDHYENCFSRRPRFLEVTLVEEGSILYRYADGQETVVSPGMFSVATDGTDCKTSAFRGQHQRHTTVGVEMQYRCRLHENDSPVEKTALLERMRENPDVFLVPQQEPTGESFPIFLNDLKKVIALHASPHPADRMRALAAYYSFAARLTELVLQREQSERVSPAAVRYVRMAKEYIHSHYTEKIRVEHIARSLGISEGYLHSLFQKVMGYGILEYCNLYRVEMAIQCMKGRGMRLKEMALQVGIEDPYYMSRLFKKVTGISQREYRKRFFNVQ